LGYSTLFYWIHADNERKINKSNITYGLGVGATLFDNISLSLGYQHLGNTSDYEGNKYFTTFISKYKPLKLALLRVAYRFNWDTIF
jgi:opacity protein-like surface antigen